MVVIICRCETISEGEIIDAIHRSPKPVSLDGIKRRCNAGMGRCQSGFCGPRVQEILAKELGVSQLDIMLDKNGSYIFVRKNKRRMAMNNNYDVVIIGGGPAGLASAIAAKKNGANSVLIIERDKELGGILNQCIHNGFGLHHFKEELTGPEYAGKYIDEVNKTDIDILLDTMVIEITPDKWCIVQVVFMDI